METPEQRAQRLVQEQEDFLKWANSYWETKFASAEYVERFCDVRPEHLHGITVTGEHLPGPLASVP